MLQIETIPCLSDNYAYLAHDPASGQTALVDAPEAAPILARLAEKQWSLSHILLTHHHPDHTGGVAAIKARHDCVVVGNAADAKRLPPLDLALDEGGEVKIGDFTGTMFDVSGHTIGHVFFHFPQAQVAFTADSLMAMGCGRVFEGTKPQMYAALQKIAALPSDTLICSGHEYTQANAAFAVTVDPENPELKARIAEIAEKRAKGEPTVPTTLAEELRTNPFLRADNPAIQQQLGMTGADPVEVFTEIRTRKDNF